jgi:hypothetical protein
LKKLSVASAWMNFSRCPTVAGDEAVLDTRRGSVGLGGLAVMLQLRLSVEKSIGESG